MSLKVTVGLLSGRNSRAILAPNNNPNLNPNPKANPNHISNPLPTGTDR